MATKFNPGDRVIGMGPGVVVAVDVPPYYGVGALPIQIRYLVRFDRKEWREPPIADSSGCVPVREEALRLDLTPMAERLKAFYSIAQIPPEELLTKFCPECEEEDFFFVGDYICASCRCERMDDQGI